MSTAPVLDPARDDLSDAQEDPTDAQVACPNCEAPRAGDYCSGCGHSFRIERLTFKVLFAEFARRFLNFEQGLLRTVKEMTLDPGGVARRYIEGQRKRYANPFTYVVFGTAAYVLTYRYSGEMDRQLSEVLVGITAEGVVDPATLALTESLTALYVGNMLYLTLISILPTALLLRWLLSDRGYTTAEQAVMPLYVYGHCALLFVLTTPIVAWLELSAMVNSLLMYGIYLAYFVWAALGLFASGKAAVLTALSVFIGQASLMGVGMIAAIVMGVVAVQQGTLDVDRDWTLRSATEAGVVRVMEDLLEAGADPDMTSTATPLHIAVEQRNEEAVRLLLAYGADPNLANDNGLTPAHLALRSNQQDLAMALLEAGAELDAAASNGNTLLIDALLAEHDEAARRIIERGADVNAIREHEVHPTALMIAADDGNLEMVTLLLEHGADPTVTNERGGKVLDVAEGDDVIAALQIALSAP